MLTLLVREETKCCMVLLLVWWHCVISSLRRDVIKLCRVVVLSLLVKRETIQRVVVFMLLHCVVIVGQGK
jgi:hypothetical protein